METFKVKNEFAVVCSGDFYYDLFLGGYLNPKDILENEADVEVVNKAISIIDKYEETLRQCNLIEE